MLRNFADVVNRPVPPKNDNLTAEASNDTIQPKAENRKNGTGASKPGGQ
jgi:hypothetical protein